MKTTNFFAFVFISFMLFFSNPSFAKNNALIGIWLSDVKSHIKIEQCGSGLCGQIIKVSIRPELYEANKQAIDKVGVQNAYDYFNKDSDLRQRRLLGLQVLTLEQKENEFVYSGHVYNPEDGKTYKGKIELIDKDQLLLTGCAFMGIICKSETWYRIK